MTDAALVSVFFFFFFVYLCKRLKDLNMILLEKLFYFIFFFSICIVIKETFLFALSFYKTERLEVTTVRQILLASSLSYVITCIVTGFRFLV